MILAFTKIPNEFFVENVAKDIWNSSKECFHSRRHILSNDSILMINVIKVFGGYLPRPNPWNLLRPFSNQKYIVFNSKVYFLVTLQ